MQDQFLSGGQYFRSEATTTDLTVGDMHMSINTPEATRSQSDELGEKAQGLPPYAKVGCVPYSLFVNPDPSWVGDDPEENIAAYVMPVSEGRGMWFDFTSMQNHNRHVAVLPTVQGINPITGKPNRGYQLIKYKEVCPVHGVQFTGARFCSECGYEWPPQNYLASTADSAFWLDGWRTEDGKIRQWYFTENTAKGVANAHFDGRQTYSVGMAFYESVDEKPQVYRSRGAVSKGVSLESYGTRGATRSFSAPSYEVGAGALIKQRIGRDPKDFDFWNPKLKGVIIVNYIDAALLANIIAQGGLKRRTSEGALGGLGVDLGF